MAIITRYVNTASVGGDGTTNNTTGATAAYATLSAWNSTEAVNLVAAGDSHVVNCEGVAADASSVTISATWTTGVSNTLTINGNLTTANWNTSEYRLSAGAYPLIVNILNVYINNMQAENGVDDNNIGAIQVAAGADLTCNKCIFRIKPQTYTFGNNAYVVDCGTDRSVDLKISNTLVYGADTVGSKTNTTGIRVNNHTAGSTFLHNVTVADCVTNVKDNFSAVTAKNVLSTGGTTADFSGPFNVNSKNNASSDATAVGTNSRINQTFTFVDSANGDFTLAATDAGARNFGADLSVDADLAVSDDIIGTARP